MSKIEDYIKQTDVSIYEDSLKTIYKIQYGKELDSWDECNLQYTIEHLLKEIIKELKCQK